MQYLMLLGGKFEGGVAILQHRHKEILALATSVLNTGTELLIVDCLDDPVGLNAVIGVV